MTFRDYVAVMSLATISAWIAWIVVIFLIDPYSAGAVGFLFFYLTLGLSLIGSLSLIGVGVRIWRGGNSLLSRYVAVSFRQALLLTMVMIVSLLLLPVGLFKLWSVSLLILAVSCVELSFLLSKRPRV